VSLERKEEKWYAERERGREEERKMPKEIWRDQPLQQREVHPIFFRGNRKINPVRRSIKEQALSVREHSFEPKWLSGVGWTSRGRANIDLHSRKKERKKKMDK
jgi:hypothetical protein